MDTVSSWYQWAMVDKSDTRTSDWLLVDRPFTTLGIVVLYLLFVRHGRRFMEKRPAFSLHRVLVVYNLALVILSTYMFWEFVASSVLQPRFSWVCQPVDYSDNAPALRLANVCWWYFFSKVIELLDTVFFILRKKNNQVSFLHVYHHASMVLLWWVGVRYVAGGESYFSATANCLIHILMYTYYLLSAMGPHMQKYLWWKQYMTSLQLIQFFVIFIHTAMALYWDCGIPRAYEWALLAYMVSHIILFSNFYHKTYVKGGRNDKVPADSNGKYSEQNGNGKKYE